MTSSPTLLKSFQIYAHAASALVIAGSVLVLVGWATNNPQLTSLCPTISGEVLPFLGQLHSSSAICLLMCAIALLLSLRKSETALAGSAAFAIATVLSCLPAIYVAATREDFEPFFRVFAPDDAAPGITFPVPMALEVAVCILLLGLSILLTVIPKCKNLLWAQSVAIASMAIPLLILLGAATKVPHICALGECFTMSTGFAALALILATGVFLSRTEALVKSFAAATIAGALLRRCVVLFFFVPFLLIARTVLVNSPLGIDEQTGWLLFVFTLLVSMVALVASGVKTVNAIEQSRTQIASELQEAIENKEQLASVLKETKEALDRTRDMSNPTLSQPTLRYKAVCLECAQEYDQSVQVCPTDGRQLNKVVDESLIGTIFAEKYKVKEMLGEGGMSTVYRATHIFVNKDVAIKVLKGNAGTDKESLKRFMREARAAGSLNHPGIVSVADFGLSPDGRAYLIMDYLEGISLSQFLQANGPLGEQLFHDIAGQICDAVFEAHRQGVVHRDLKPSNIMLASREDGTKQVKIVDFGLAKLLEEQQDPAQKVTQTGMCFGSPLYMSPEQCMGVPIDARSDIYALGCIFYECLVGDPPIRGNTAADTIRKHMTEIPNPFPAGIDIGDHIKTAIVMALHKKPEFRQKNAIVLKMQLLHGTAAGTAPGLLT